MTIETSTEETIHYLYCITNIVNNKIYIGQSIDTVRRWYEHKRSANKDNPVMLISQSIKKHGAINFEFKVIAACKTYENANYLEEQLIIQYNSLAKNNGYNLSLGGMNAPKSEAWKQIMRDHWADPVWRKNQIQLLLQAQSDRTPEEKEKTAQLLSDLLTGRHLNIDTEFKKEHKLSPESLQKLSNSNKGHVAWNKNTIGVMKSNKQVFNQEINLGLKEQKVLPRISPN